jgi:hypothetical protein
LLIEKFLTLPHLCEDYLIKTFLCFKWVKD